MFRTNRDLPTKTEIDIIISKNSDNYLLVRGKRQLGDANSPWVFDDRPYKVELKDLLLQVRRVAPNKSVIAANDAKLLRSPALYPFNRWTCSEETLVAGQSIFTTSTMFKGFVPSKTIYLLLEQSAYKGSDPNKNPSLFKNWGIKQFAQKINGNVAPLKEHKYDWKNGNVLDSYRSIFDACGISTLNRSNLLTLKAYKHHRFMVVYDNSCDGISFDECREKSQLGTVNCELEFEEDLTTTLTLVGFGITDDYMALDQGRSAYINCKPPMY